MDTQLLEQPLVQEKAELLRDLILHNDDVNTFEFVIDTLIEVCGQNPIQAEQCAFIVHHNGKCGVKKGSYEDLEPMCVALLDKGLSASID
jgi:ATP-dependent Clp protease adaptor protein ClpS